MAGRDMTVALCPGTIVPGTIVRYDHPDWGQCRGRVLRLAGVRVLVEDLSPAGAREWVDTSTIDRPTQGAPSHGR